MCTSMGTMDVIFVNSPEAMSEYDLWTLMQTVLLPVFIWELIVYCYAILKFIRKESKIENYECSAL